MLKKEFYYTVRLSGLNDNIITGKFDTGAVTTKKLGILPKSFLLLFLFSELRT